MPFEVLHTTYADNRWCPPERAALYESYAAADPYRHRVWALGLWATKQTGNEFYPGFSRAAHVKPTPYLLGVPIMQSWDANSMPYCAMLNAQPFRPAPGQLQIRIFKEYALRSPNSGLAPTAKQFLHDRKVNNWQSSELVLVGDSTLRNRKPGDEHQTDFKDIEAAMLPALHSASMALWPRKNPGVMRRRDFVNYVLRGGYPGISVQFDPDCVESIADMELTQLGVNEKFKEMYNDKALGIRYQIRGHFSDDVDYLLTTLLAPEYAAFKLMHDG